MIFIWCVSFASLDVVCDELNDCAWNLGLYQLSVVSIDLLISSVPVIVRAGEPFG